MRVPDFFLVGAPKCGTTALYAMLAGHPDVHVSPVKEPDFFAGDVVAAVPGLAATAVTEWPRYLALFDAAGAARAVGEGSVSYLASEVAAGAIRARCPEARILMILRDPAARLFSHYTAALAAGVTRAPFSRWLDAVILREAATAAPILPVRAGRYASHLRRYRDHFSASRIHIVWHEDFVRDPAAALSAIFRHLDVDPNYPVPAWLRRNETLVPRWPVPQRWRLAVRRTLAPVVPAAMLARARTLSHRPVSRQMTPAERLKAIDLYAPDIIPYARR
jgi:hypothetical protein